MVAHLHEPAPGLNSSVTASPTTGKGPDGRYRSLDGLRGIAALIVLLCHILLVQPAVMLAFVDPSTASKGSIEWWLTLSPLHLAWAGTEAVFIFFVLSGFVLALPFVGHGKGDWGSYYPKRLLRLYLPVWAAVGLAVLWMTAVPRQFSAEDSAFLLLHVQNLTAENLQSDMLLFGLLPASNPVLWSLRYEVLFSLLLPLYLVFSRMLWRYNALKFGLLAAAVVAFSFWRPGTAGVYLPMFALGTIMAVERRRMAEWAGRISRQPHGKAVWAGLTLVTLLLLNSFWTLNLLTADADLLRIFSPLTQGLIVIGASMAVFLAVGGAWRGLEHSVIQWLGKRSFSLYLVHQPLVVAVAALLGGSPSFGLMLAVTVPSSLLLAEIFYRLVEGPSHFISRRIGKGIEGWNLRHSIAQPAPVAAARIDSPSA